MTGGRQLEATAWDAFGAAKPVKVEVEGETALLRVDSEPTGLGIKVTAK